MLERMALSDTKGVDASNISAQAIIWKHLRNSVSRMHADPAITNSYQVSRFVVTQMPHHEWYEEECYQKVVCHHQGFIPQKLNKLCQIQFG